MLASSGCFRDKCQLTTELVNKLECILKQQLHLTAHIPLLFVVCASSNQVCLEESCQPCVMIRVETQHAV